MRGYLAVGDTLNSNPILPVVFWSPCCCAWITAIKYLSWVCDTILHIQFICLKGRDNWNVKHTLSQGTQWGIISCVFVYSVYFLSLAPALAAAQDSACEVYRLNTWPCGKRCKGEGMAAAFQLQYGYDLHCNAPCCSGSDLPPMLLPGKI